LTGGLFIFIYVYVHSSAYLCAYGDDRVICYLGADDVSDDVFVLSWLLLCKMDQLGLAILDHLDHRLFHFKLDQDYGELEQLVSFEMLTKLLLNYNFIIINFTIHNILLFTMWSGLNKSDLGFYLFSEHY